VKKDKKEKEAKKMTDRENIIKLRDMILGGLSDEEIFKDENMVKTHIKYNLFAKKCKAIYEQRERKKKLYLASVSGKK
jgi:hypothetical protein